MSRILNYIAKYDENLTLAQLKEAIKQDEISAKEKETKEVNKVKKDFKDVYLKRIYDCDLFGETLQVLYILEIADTHKTTDYKTVYQFKGNRLSFSKHDINFQVIKGDDTYHSFSEEELREMKRISLFEYKKYKVKYNELANELKNLIKL